MADHRDSSTSLRDRDNNTQEHDYHDMLPGGREACDQGALQLERTEIDSTSGSADIHCYDSYYNDPDWFGFTHCDNVDWSSGRCDHYIVKFDNSDVDAYPDTQSEWDAYRYIGCHEFGHTSSVGHRPNNAGTCMDGGSGDKRFDDHDLTAINLDYP
jgi:hypothetical protein